MEKKKSNQIYWYAGIAAALVYVTGVTVGGLLYPGYSHISQDVSQLTSVGSPVRDLMNYTFWPYNVLVTIFGVGLYTLGKKTSLNIGAIFVVSIGILGFLIAFFPIDTRGTPLTMTGIAHIAIVSIVSLLTVMSGFMIWKGLVHSKYARIARVSLFTSIGFLISGPVAGITVTSPYAGLTERIPIGIFLAWMLLTSVSMLRGEHKTRSAS